MPDPPAPSPFRPVRSDWRQGAGGSTAASGRGPLRAFVLIALLAAAGGLAGLWFWVAPPTPPRFLTVPVSEYTDPAWPANPWAEHDSERLRAAFPDSEKAFNFQERDRFITLLEGLGGAAKDQAVVLHVSALACVRDGAVHLLPGQAAPDDPATWLPLADVLARFAACPAKAKLLLLDVARPVADPFRGPLVDDAADRLHALLAQSPPGFLVLTSCGPGEFALPLDDEQSSVFAYYAARGLAGPADRYNSGQATDGRVSARELAAFVAARVSRWADKARGARQTPTLYGDAADFPLTFAAHPAPEPAAPTAAYPPPLADGWKRRDDRRVAGVHRAAPAVVARLGATLLRAERAWEAGLAERVRQRLPVDLDEIDSPGDRARGEPRPPLRSLVAARVGRPEPPADLVKALEKYLAVRSAVPPPKPEDLQKALAEFLEKAKPHRLDSAGLIWDQLLSDPEPSDAKVRDLAALFDQVQPPPCEEGLLLRRLAAWQPRAIVWPAAAVHALLRAEDAAGRAFGLLSAAFPWAREPFAAADTAKREGEQKLLDARSRVMAQEAADRLNQAERDYTAARRQLEIIQTARRAVADAALVLAGTANGVVVGDVDEYLWRDAADTARSLAEVLTRGPGGGGLPPAFEGQLNTLQARVRTLEAPYAPAAVQKQAAATAVGGPAEYRALRALLRGPLAKAPERKSAWEAGGKLSSRLHCEVVQLDQADDEANRITAAPQSVTPDGAEAERAVRRVRVSVGLLRLVGLDGGDRLDAPARAAAGDGPALAAGLRDAWAKQLPEQLRQRVAKADWSAADRLCRGPALPNVRATEGVETPPAVRLWRQEDEACRQWLEGHYRETGRLRAAVSGAADFYEEAAADCRR